MNSTNNSDVSFIRENVESGVKTLVSQAFDRKKKELVDELDKEKDILVAGILLNVMKHVQIETLRENIVVTIKKIESKV